MFNALKNINKLLEIKIQIYLKELEIIINKNKEIDARKQWDLETGKVFNDLISKYPISEEELLSISEKVANLVMESRSKI